MPPLRRDTLARAIAAVTVGLLLHETPVAAQPQPITADGTYASESRLVSSRVGVSFTVPEGFAGQWDPELSALVLQSSTPVIGAVWAWSEGGIDEVATEVGRLLSVMGVELIPHETPLVTSDSLSGVYTAITPEGPGLLVARIRRGPAGNTVAYAALGTEAARGAAEAFVEDVGASLEWSPPEAGAWRAAVAGTVLSRSATGSDMSTGTTTATGASQTRATLALCEAAYRYTESSESYVSIEGMSASSTSGDEHAGEWYVVADLVGAPTLYLESGDGRAFAWPVQEAGGGYRVNGHLYTPSGGC